MGSDTKLLRWANARRGNPRQIADEVYRQLLDDFPPEALGWVRAARWVGPVRVPLDQIDFSGRDKWAASKDKKKVHEFAELIKQGKAQKPIVLVNEPNNKKAIDVDGHHRLLGYEEAGEDAIAYMADVDAVEGPWTTMHASQRTGPSKYDGQP